MHWFLTRNQKSVSEVFGLESSSQMINPNSIQKCQLLKGELASFNITNSIITNLMEVRNIRFLNNKKNIILISTIFLFNFCFLIPTTFGYGSSFSDAEVKTGGIYSETLASSDIAAWYKIFCKPGDDLDIYVSDFGHYYIDWIVLYLYDSTQQLQDTETFADPMMEVHHFPTVEGPCYLAVARNLGTGDISFTLQIEGATGVDPGPILLIILISVIIGVAVISIATLLLLKRRKKRMK